MDLTSRLKDFFAKRAGAAVKSVESIPQDVASFGSGLLKALPGGQQVSAFSQFANNPQAQKQLATNVGNVANAIQSNPIVKTIASRPLINQPGSLPFSGLFTGKGASYSPTIGEFAQGRIVNPAVGAYNNAVNAFNNSAPALSRVGSAVMAPLQAMQLTPVGQGAMLPWEGIDAIKGGMKALRRGEDVNLGIKKGLTGQEFTGLGDAVTGNKTLAGALNTGEMVGPLLHGMVKNNPVSVAKGMVMKRQYDKVVSELEPNIKDLMVRFEKTMGEAYNPTNPTVDLNLENDARQIWKTMYGLNRSAPADIKRVVGDIFEGYNGWRTEQQMAQQGIRMGFAQPKQIGKIVEERWQEIPFGAKVPVGSELKLENGKQFFRPPPGTPPEVTNPENPFYNVKRVGVSPEKQLDLKQTVENSASEIGGVVGKTLSHDEVIQAAKAVPDVLKKTMTREDTLALGAQALNLRNEVARMANSGKVTPEFIDALVKDKAMGENLARLLGQRVITSDAAEKPMMQQVLEQVLKKNQNTDEILKAAEGVDFNDANQAANFYRQFVKPKMMDYLDLIRYNSMLSSPNTHINNASSNLLNTGVVAPIEKTLTGAIDFLASKTLGKEQTQFMGEGAAYTKGYYSKLGEAAHRFADVVRGKRDSTNLDLRMLSPLHGRKGDLFYSLPTRLLEASDQFFTALTEGGEKAALDLRKSKGVNTGNADITAMENAAYRLYRSPLHDKRQGMLLNSVDDLTSKIQSLRNAKNPVTSLVAKFTLPFVRTPMNIFKQMIEYSPTGVATIPGATNKSEQLSKAILGTAGMTATMMLVSSGRTTWAEPTDPKKRAAFRAAGMQPYAVKIGNNWVAYSKLPPAMAIPLTLTSALHDAYQNKTIDQTQLDAILTGVAKSGNFFADQSYLKNISDAIAATKGSPENIASFVSNYPQQLIPYRALFGWLARLTDPYQRKVDTDAPILQQQVQQLMTQFPGLSQNVPSRKDQFGNPISNQNKEINAFSPLRVTTENQQGKENYNMMQDQSLLNKNMKAAEKQIQQGKEPDFSFLSKANAAEVSQSSVQQDIKNKAMEKMTMQKVKLTGKDQELNGTLYHYDQGNVKKIALDTTVKAPDYTGDPLLDKKLKSKFLGDVTAAENSVLKQLQLGKLSEDEAAQKIKSLEEQKNGGAGGGRKKASLKVDFRSLAKSLSSVKPVRIHLSKTHSTRVTPRISKPGIKEFRLQKRSLKKKK